MDTLIPHALTQVLDAERAALRRLHRMVEQTGFDPATTAQLGELVETLDALFLVVVVGEFNAGKSSVLNALFGERIMEEGPIPTTAKITILRHGDEPLERQLSEFVRERRHPHALLEHLHFVDTPGTNSIVRQHQEITERFIPRADLVLFVTSYDRPLSESERQFLSFIRDAWGKRLVFVLNKADLARSDEALAQVVAHIESGCEELMGFRPQIFPVSAELAQAAHEAAPGAARETLRRQSRFDALEAFIRDDVAGPSRAAQKLRAPLDTAARLLERHGEHLGARQAAHAQDEANLAGLRARMDEARRELREGYNRFLAEIDNLILELDARGAQFLEDTIRIGKIGLLRDRDRFKEAFAQHVVRDVDRQIEDRITHAVDWLMEHALALWNRTLDDFARRVPGGAAGHAPGYNRTEIFGAMKREADRRLQTHDVRAEARRILENARDAADMFQYTEAAALGLGAVSGLTVVLAGATTLDALGGLGVASALTAGAAGLAYLPRQRKKAKREWHERLDALRNEMRRALAEQFDHEIDASLDRVGGTVAPYAERVEAEQALLTSAAEAQAALEKEVAELRERVAEA